MKKAIIITATFILVIAGVVLAGKPGRNLLNSNEISMKASGDNSEIVYLTDESFRKMVFDYEKNKEWKYEGSKPAIIDFYADWCGPCKQLSPLVEELSHEYHGKLIVYKVDTDKEQKLTQSLGITALPTLLFIPANGSPRAVMGAVPKETLIKAVNEVLLVK